MAAFKFSSAELSRPACIRTFEPIPVRWSTIRAIHQSARQLTHCRMRRTFGEMRIRIATIALALWGFALNIALQQGFFDWVPGWAVLLMLAVPICAWVFMGLTHNRIRRYLHQTSPIMAIIVFVAVGAALGGVVGGVVYALWQRSETAGGLPVAASPRKDPHLVSKKTEQKNETPKPNKMKSVHDLFMTESKYLTVGGDTVFTITNSETRQATTIPISIKLHMDFLTNSKFLSVYVPTSPRSFEFCRGLPEVYEGLLSQAVRPTEEFVMSGPSEMPVSSKGLVFTGQILIYHEDDFTLKQQAELEEIFKKKNLFPQLRGVEYASTRWLQEEAVSAIKARSTKQP